MFLICGSPLRWWFSSLKGEGKKWCCRNPSNLIYRYVVGGSLGESLHIFVILFIFFFQNGESKISKINRQIKWDKICSLKTWISSSMQQLDHLIIIIIIIIFLLSSQKIIRRERKKYFCTWRCDDDTWRCADTPLSLLDFVCGVESRTK
jgi:hypothetical protein